MCSGHPIVEGSPSSAPQASPKPSAKSDFPRGSQHSFLSPSFPPTSVFPLKEQLPTWIQREPGDPPGCGGTGSQNTRGSLPGHCQLLSRGTHLTTGLSPSQAPELPAVPPVSPQGGGGGGEGGGGGRWKAQAPKGCCQGPPQFSPCRTRKTLKRGPPMV